MKAGSVLKHVISAAGQLISILNVSSRAPASSEAYILVNTGVYAGVNRCMVRQNKRIGALHSSSASCRRNILRSRLGSYSRMFTFAITSCGPTSVFVLLVLSVHSTRRVGRENWLQQHPPTSLFFTHVAVCLAGRTVLKLILANVTSRQDLLKTTPARCMNDFALSLYRRGKLAVRFTNAGVEHTLPGVCRLLRGSSTPRMPYVEL